MRKIYYLTGLTAMGKTTTAQALANLLDVEFLSVDNCYQHIGKKIKHPNPQELCCPNKYNLIERKDKLAFWKERFANRKEDIILEGFTLFFEDERKVIKEAIGEPVHEIMLLIKLSYDKWDELHYKKHHRHPQLVTYNGYYKKYFQIPSCPVYECHTLKEVLAKICNYQRTGFTDIKWDRLKMISGELKNKTVLDIGCNDGWIGKYCLEAGAKRITGLDKNWRYLEGARSRGTEVVKMLLDTDFKNFFPGIKYDYIFCLATFHYIENKKEFLKKIFERTGKQFILEMPVFKSDKKFVAIPKPYDYTVPSEPLLVEWLKELPFLKIEKVGESIPPDNSYRVIYKCYV